MSPSSRALEPERASLGVATLQLAERQAFELYKSYFAIYPDIWAKKFFQETIVDVSISFALRVRRIHEISAISLKEIGPLQQHVPLVGDSTVFEPSYQETVQRLVHCRSASVIVADAPQKLWPSERNLVVLGLSVTNEHGQGTNLNVLGLVMAFLGVLFPQAMQNLSSKPT
jgi:hypothetical protein